MTKEHSRPPEIQKNSLLEYARSIAGLLSTDKSADSALVVPLLDEIEESENLSGLLEVAQLTADEVKNIVPPTLINRVYPLIKSGEKATFFFNHLLLKYVKNRGRFPAFCPSPMDDLNKDFYVDEIRRLWKVEEQDPGIWYFLSKHFDVIYLHRYLGKMDQVITLYRSSKKNNPSPGEVVEDLKNETILMFRDLGLTEEEGAKIWQTWVRCCSEKLQVVLSNLKAVKALEAKNKDACAALVREFGIHLFSRFTEGFLLEQFKEKETQGEYLLIVLPRSDHNLAMENKKEVYNSLLFQLSPVPIRVVEVGSVREFLRQMWKLRKKYGNRKIAAGIIGGHSNGEFIRFGFENSKGEYSSESPLLVKEHVLHPTTQVVKDCFIDNPDIVLIACSSGKENGIGQEFSQQLSAYVQSPLTPTNISTIAASCSDQRIRLNAIYSHEGITQVYQDGDPQ